MKKSFRRTTFISVVIYLQMLLGYVVNIYRFAKLDFKPSYRAEFVRGAGIIVPPLGSILSIIPIFDIKEN